MFTYDVGIVNAQTMVAENEAAKERNAEGFTQAVLDLRDKYTTIINDAFASDRLFLQALNASFEVRAVCCCAWERRVGATLLEISRWCRRALDGFAVVHEVKIGIDASVPRIFCRHFCLYRNCLLPCRGHVVQLLRSMA